MNCIKGQSSQPMPGTILDDKGLFLGETNDDRDGKFANLLVAAMLRRNENLLFKDMDSTRKALEATMKDSAYMKSINAAVHGNKRITPVRFSEDRAGVRRMMVKYWDNSSIFGLDLVGAVIRQGTFVQKMVDLDWLNSPAVSSTAARLVTKYTRFMSLMAQFKTTLFVPTLDVDLAWHTHQLSSSSYYNYTVTNCGQFVDHDDKIAETKLSDAFSSTTQLYEMLFKEAYSECLCWYCEAIRASHAPTKGLFKKTLLTSDAEKQLYAHAAELGISDDPAKGNHISTHNAIRPTEQSYLTKKAQDKLQKDFEKAVKRALKDGRKPPEKRHDDIYGYGAFYPFPMPFAYSYGYVGAPIYVAAPACGSSSSGAAGNCCAGTCGGGAGAGACGAGGFGGGSCGGGGGGGACGGGGGGGGGGCGGGGGG